MRNLLTFMILGLLLTTGMSFKKAPKALAEGPMIQIDEPVYDFGTFKEGEIKDHSFTFKNVGSAPLVIHHVEKPCGCTTPTWPKEPIMPGKTGKINVEYNSKDRPGVFRKSLQVKTNMTDNATVMLMIKGNATK